MLLDAANLLGKGVMSLQLLTINIKMVKVRFR